MCDKKHLPTKPIVLSTSARCEIETQAHIVFTIWQTLCLLPLCDCYIILHMITLFTILLLYAILCPSFKSRPDH